MKKNNKRSFSNSIAVILLLTGCLSVTNISAQKKNKTIKRNPISCYDGQTRS